MDELVSGSLTNDMKLGDEMRKLLSGLGNETKKDSRWMGIWLASHTSMNIFGMPSIIAQMLDGRKF